MPAATSQQSIAAFSADIAKFLNRVREEDVPLAAKALAFEAYSQIVRATPVDTGRARGNWQITAGAPAGGVVDRKAPAGGEGAVMSEEGQKLYSTPVAFPPQFWITNNVPYILVLEEGGFVPPDPGPSSDPRKGRKGRVLVQGGYSIQAPQGMVKLVVERLRNWLIPGQQGGAGIGRRR